jgi:hypothetical protein
MAGQSRYAPAKNFLMLARPSWPFLPGEEASLAVIENTTHSADRKACIFRIDEAED